MRRWTSQRFHAYTTAFAVDLQHHGKEFSTMNNVQIIVTSAIRIHSYMQHTMNIRRQCLASAMLVECFCALLSHTKIPLTKRCVKSRGPKIKRKAFSIEFIYSEFFVSRKFCHCHEQFSTQREKKGWNYASNIWKLFHNMNK